MFILWRKLVIKDLETAAYMAGYKAGKKKMGAWWWVFFAWVGLMTLAMATAMFFLAGWYINDYFCF